MCLFLKCQEIPHVNVNHHSVLCTLYCTSSFGCACLGCCAGFSVVVASRATPVAVLKASRCSGPSRCGAQALGHWLNSYAARFSCSVARGILPDQGTETRSPALAGRLITTEAPGKSSLHFSELL